MTQAEIEQIHGEDVCPVVRVGADDGAHEWRECSVDPDGPQAYAAHSERYPTLVMCHSELLKHWTCQHCEALAVEPE
jgi:hypothetical protein